MPAQIHWARRSLADLTGIVSFIAADNPAAAHRVVAELKEHARRLAEFPRTGKVYHVTSRGEVRELAVSPYRLFYRVETGDHVIRVLRVWHAARGTPDL